MKISIRWALIAGFLGLIWGTQMIITSSMYVSSEQVLLNHAKSIMSNITEYTMDQSKNYLGLAQRAVHLTNRMISDKVIWSDLSSTDLTERYFFNQLSTNPHFAGIYYGKPNGEFFYVSRSNEKNPDGFRTKIIRIVNGVRETKLVWRNALHEVTGNEIDPDDTFDPRKRPWYQKALKDDRIVWTDPYIFFTSKKPGLTIAGPAKDETGRLIGIVGVDIDIEQLSYFISKQKIGKNGMAFIFNNNEDVVAYPDVEKIKNNDSERGTNFVKVNQINDPLTQKAFNSLRWAFSDDNRLILNHPQFTKFTYSGKTYHTMFSPFNETQWPWIICVFIPEDDYLGNLKENRWFNVKITIGISILATILALLLARTIIRPISNLENEARAIENFDMLSHYDIQSIYDEIQLMSDTFNRMKNSLTKHENEKSRLENQLIRSERLAVTGHLASSIAHEINSPLQSMVILIKTLLDKYKHDGNLVEDLFLINDVFLTIQNRIKSFQDLNRPFMSMKEPSDMNAIIEKTVNLVRINLSKNLIKVNLDLDPRLPVMNVAFQHFSQIFLNIINNSIDAISKNSDIDINSLSTDERLPVAGMISIRTLYKHDHIVIQITDTGPGIPDDMLPAIFDYFVGQRNNTGMGIGLAICKGIVTEYNGDITASNRVDGGAEITITIPVTPEVEFNESKTEASQRHELLT